MSFKLQHHHLILNVLLRFHPLKHFPFNIKPYIHPKVLLISLISEQTSKNSSLLLLEHKLNRKVESINVSDSLEI